MATTARTSRKLRRDARQRLHGALLVALIGSIVLGLLAVIGQGQNWLVQRQADQQAAQIEAYRPTFEVSAPRYETYPANGPEVAMRGVPHAVYTITVSKPERYPAGTRFVLSSEFAGQQPVNRSESNFADSAGKPTTSAEFWWPRSASDNRLMVYVGAREPDGKVTWSWEQYILVPATR